MGKVQAVKNERGVVKLTKKKILTCAIALTFIVLIKIVFSPINFSDKILESTHVNISYIRTDLINGQPTQYLSDYSFDVKSEKFHDVINLLKTYSYHRCFESFKGNAEIKGNTETLIISFYEEPQGVSELYVIANVPNIIVGQTVYRVGYWGNSTSNRLFNEFKEILDIE